MTATTATRPAVELVSASGLRERDILPGEATRARLRFIYFAKRGAGADDPKLSPDEAVALNALDDAAELVSMASTHLKRGLVTLAAACGPSFTIRGAGGVHRVWAAIHAMLDTVETIAADSGQDVPDGDEVVDAIKT